MQLYVCGITFFSLWKLIVICAVFESFYTMLRWSVSLFEVFLCVFHDLWLSITVLTQTLLVSNNVLIKVTLAQTCVLYSQLQPDVLGFVGIFQQFIYRPLYWTINSLLNCQHNNCFSTFKLLNV